MSDELWEFTHIDVDRIDLVGMPANGVPTPVLAKSQDPNQEGNPMFELETELRKALTGVDLNDQHRPGGHGSGASTIGKPPKSVPSDVLDERHLGQTRYVDGGRGGRSRPVTGVLAGVYKALDRNVEDSDVAVAAARHEFASMRAEADLDQARRTRYFTKSVIVENARANGTLLPSRWGPGVVDMFNSSSLTLPDDNELGYYNDHGRR